MQSPGELFVVTGGRSGRQAFETPISIFRGDFCSGDVECVATNDNAEERGELSSGVFPAKWGEDCLFVC